VLLEPEFERMSVQTSGVPEQTIPALADTTAVLENVPISPKTNPETEIAAIRVMATSITVARTGDIAGLLPLTGCIVTEKCVC
jgi:Glu-tRNA(Gln) amidotransferase subunit E-like FAD-binding protein